MKEIFISKNAFEYLCFDCKQLRLSLNKLLDHCGNCGSKNIRKGAVGTLEKSMLKDGGDP